MPVQDFISRPPYQVVQPGAYSAVDASLLANPNPGPRLPLGAIVGVAFGGQPGVPMYIRSPGQLRQVLLSGPAYDVARFAFDGGAQMVCVVRVGNAVSQASLALAGTGTVVTLTARDWGSWCNSILVSVAAGPIITLSYTSSLGVVYTEKWDFTGIGSLTPAQIANAINGKTVGFSASNFVTAAAGGGTLPMSTISNQPLTGGTDGTAPVAGDWTVGLQALETQDLDFVLVATGDATVHAQTQAHCANMSVPAARKERVMVCGGVLGESAAQAVARLAALPSGRVQLVYPGMKDYDNSGNLVTYDPFYLAGKIMGMHCGLPDVATSLLHHRVPIVDAEVQLSTVQGGAIDQLLAAGVTPIAPAPRAGFWVVDSLTGYNAPDQTFHDLHKTRSADFVAQYARGVLEAQFVGSKILLGSQRAIEVAANDLMGQLKRMTIIQDFKGAVITAGPNINSFNVGLPVMLVDATKFIFITVALQPSATVANTASLTASDVLA